jgi:hypothetical protein
MAATDIVTVASKGNAQRRDVRVRTLLRDGLEILKTPLTGIADNFTSLELESGSLKSS